MKKIVWNARGAARPEFMHEVRDLLNTFNPHIMIILDTPTRMEASESIIRSLSFIGRIIAPSMGQHGGIWVLWHAPTINASVLLLSPRMIHLLVDYNHALYLMNVTAVYQYPQANL